MPNAKTAVTPDAYQEFIMRAVAAHSGQIMESELDALIVAKYQPHWTATDRAPWGNQSHSKWRQNVASAKSGLDRRGVVVRFVERMKDGEQLVWRVMLPNSFVANAVIQWWHRQPQRKKKQYRRLAQPKGKYIVPDVTK